MLMSVPLDAVFAPKTAVAELPVGAAPVLQFEPVSQAPLAVEFHVCAGEMRGAEDKITSGRIQHVPRSLGRHPCE
jgi:hypothetical protein